MYEKAPDEKELQAFGLTLEDVAMEPVEIWPENETAFHLFSALGTQWRVGMSGATGMDFGVVYHKMDRMKLTDAEFDDLEQAIQTMEREALKVMRSDA